MCDHSDDVDELSASDASDPEEQPSGAPFDPELDHDDNEDNDDNVVEAVASAPATQTPFSLRGGSSAFSDRSHSIFDCLDTQLSSSSLKQGNITHGEFVQPLPPHPSRKTSHPPSTSPTPPKKRGVPDYLVHPERWTHYSLEDVTETSDQDNLRAAHQFLSSLQQEKQSDSPCHVQQRMVFSRPKRPLKEQTLDQASAIRGNERGMHLSHLEEEEEGSEQQKEGVRRTDQSEDGTEERERHEEEDTRRKTERPEEEKQKQVPKEKDEKKTEEVDCGFASFRKTKSKNYRKSSEQEDD